MKALLAVLALAAGATPAAAQGFSTMMAGGPQPANGDLSIMSGPAVSGPTAGPYTSSPYNAVLPSPIGRGASQQHRQQQQPLTNMPILPGPGPGATTQAAAAPGFQGRPWGFAAGRGGGQPQGQSMQPARPASAQRAAPSFAFRGMR